MSLIYLASLILTVATVGWSHEAGNHVDKYNQEQQVNEHIYMKDANFSHILSISLVLDQRKEVKHIIHNENHTATAAKCS